MRLTHPRIHPVPDDQLTADQAELLAPMQKSGRVLNIFRTLAAAPKAAKGFLAWGNYILSRRNDLPAREREIVIMRTGFLCKSGYEWTQHHRISLNAGLSEAEIARIKIGAELPAGAPPTPPCCKPATNFTTTSSSPMRRGRRCERTSPRSSAWTSSSPPASTRRSR
ncbi:MAG: carboxymuconolactone decarboxylase family protein [Xanthobacteraceae bacterium]